MMTMQLYDENAMILYNDINVMVINKLWFCRPIGAGCVFSGYIVALPYPDYFISLAPVTAIIEEFLPNFLLLG